ncbi:MAG: GspH/FimT family pseudopilin [Betaproteobacteria bacterium]
MLIGRHQHGMTLIELLIGIAIFAVLMAMAIPSMTQYIQNTHIRTAAESIVSGMQYAKSEALKRNVPVRFQLVNDLSGGCNLAANGESWVVSLDDPSGSCAATMGDAAAPRILQRRNAAEGSANADVVASSTPAVGGNNSLLIYNGLGRVSLTNVNRFDRLRITNSTGTCLPGGTMRCLDIIITAGGDGKVCDPTITLNTDSRYCG